MAPDPKVARIVLRRGRKAGATREQMLAAMSTGLVESGMRNVKYGDADSLGWRQERASLYPNPTNVRAAADRFFAEAKQHDKPGFHPGELAADVQRPAEQYRGRYGERMGDAKELLRSLGGSGGGGSAGGGYRSETTPGVDRSQQRQLLKFAYLQDRDNPDALLSLAAGLGKAQDTPAKTRRVRVKEAPKARVSVRSRPNARGNPDDLRELFYNVPGALNVDEGKVVGQGFVTGHKDHAHAAFDDHKTAVAAARLARDMGLDVREIEPFDQVDPVHTAGSFHGERGQKKTQRAVDVSGNPQRVKAYTLELGRRFGVGG